MRYWYIFVERIFEVRIVSRLSQNRVIVGSLDGTFQKEIHGSNLYSSEEIIQLINYSNSDLELSGYNDDITDDHYGIVVKIWRQYKSDLRNSNNLKQKSNHESILHN